VQLWDAGTGALQQTLEGHTDGVTSVAFFTNNNNMANTLLISNEWITEEDKKFFGFPLIIVHQVIVLPGIGN